MLRSVYVILLMDPIHNLLLPATERSLARIALYIPLAIISTAVICPLEVISTRLSIQRNHDTAGFTAVSQQEEAEMENVPYAAADEDVIG